MEFSVTILGSNSAIPTANKYPTAQLVSVNHKFYLIDCGEGTQMQLRRYGIKFQRIDHIFISHLHGDHFFGLIGLLMTMQLLGREGKLTIYAHQGLKEVIELQLKVSGGKILFPLEYVELSRGQQGEIMADKNIVVSTFPLDHRIACNGFLFKEKQKPRSIIKELVDEYDVPISEYQKLKQGEDVKNRSGLLVENSLVTEDPPAQRSYAFCSDTAYAESIVPHISGVDLLYHEATFDETMADRAKETRHSTGKQAAQIAKMAKAKKLLIGHFSARYKTPDEIFSEATQIFENVCVAKEGDIYHVSN